MQTINDKLILSLHPVDIYSLLDEQFNKDGSWLPWDSETLLMQLPLVVGAIARDKVLAVKSCAFNIKVPCTQSVGFEKTCKAFSNNVCVMDMYQPLYVEEALYGVQQIKLIGAKVHGEEETITFMGEVPAYVAAVAKTRNTMVLPKPLEFAEDILTFITGYTKNPDEIELVESLDGLKHAQLFDKGLLDKLAPMDNPTDATIARLLGCYLFDPRQV